MAENLNMQKTEYIECGTKTDGMIKIDNKNLKKTLQFQYLGYVFVIPNTDGTSDTLIRLNSTLLISHRRSL